MYHEKISPSTAIEEYLNARSHEVSDATLQNHRYRLKQFRLWCEEEGFDDMRELSGRETEAFRLSREEDDLAPMTVRNQMMTVRVFTEWCETQGYVKPGIADRIRTPAVAKSDRSRDDHVTRETAEEIIEAYSQYKYGSLRHVLFHLIFRTGMRTGAVRGLDLGDIELGQDPHIRVRHRPKTDTPLKRGAEGGERHVSIVNSELAEALEAYCERNRHDVEDEYGRKPLFTSRHGRIAKTTIQSHIYRATQPCERTGNCPHEKNPGSCPYRSSDKASQCPSSVSPHAIRRSAITMFLNADVEKEVISGRCNVSRDRLEEHYDARTEESKRKTRRQGLKDTDPK